MAVSIKISGPSLGCACNESPTEPDYLGSILGPLIFEHSQVPDV